MSHTIAIDHPCSPERIVSVRWWSPDVLSFMCSRPLPLNFLPGQYARIALQVGNQLIWRPFSFVSSPEEEVLEFLGVLVPGGLFTDRLRQVDIGDTLWVEHENYGFMTLDRFDNGKHLWMLATGTGIGPFICMLRNQNVWRQFERIILVRGARSSDRLAYRDELIALQSASPDHPAQEMPRAMLMLIDCVTAESAGPEKIPELPAYRDAEAGNRLLACRMTRAWDEGALEMAAGVSINAADSRVMLCGNPAMIEDMRKRLHQRGLTPCRRQKPGQFLTENYW